DLEQEERTDVPHVLHGLGQPGSQRRTPLRSDSVDDTMRPPIAPLEPDRLDQLLLLEALERGVDERPAERPDRADLASLRELHRQRPPVNRLLRDQGEHGELARREVGTGHGTNLKTQPYGVHNPPRRLIAARETPPGRRR